ncbi:pepsin-like aspartyl protease [Crenalkalicoccus roseus]
MGIGTPEQYFWSHMDTASHEFWVVDQDCN